MIGSKVMFGPFVKIIAGNHNIQYSKSHMADAPQNKLDSGILIEDGVWVGSGAILLDGAIIGEGAVIGAGAIVTGFIPPYCVAVGAPARVIRARFDGAGLCEILRAVNSKLSVDDVNKIYDEYRVSYIPVK